MLRVRSLGRTTTEKGLLWSAGLIPKAPAPGSEHLSLAYYDPDGQLV